MERTIIKTYVALSLIFFLFFPVQALAIEKFNSDFQNYYRVDQDGNTHVTFDIKQKNNLSIVYATDFGLNINETQVKNVKVKDEGTLIIPDVIKTLNQTTISFPFAHKVVGKDKIHSFSIEYDTSDIATKFGSTWQVNIPRLEADEIITNRTVILTVPANFPSPAYIDPKPDSINENTYYFNGKSLGNKTISAVFGQTQYYKGDITYHLTNERNSTQKTQIALPPDTAYQTVFYEKLDPMPDTVISDEDGNYLASYTLKPNTDIEISLSLFIKLNFHPQPTNETPSDKYLISNEIWNYDNSIFSSSEIKNLTSPKAIYDYVVDKLVYDYEKVNRQKSQITPSAESLINHQSAICTDFTNVFVSIARKAGIPSRELQGYAISENPDLKPISLTQDVLHAWPEYFNNSTNTWTQIDPTWSNTTHGIDYFNKLDFNHIVFVIHGTNPEYPIPAGGYKYKQEKTKDISISPANNTPFPEPSFTISSVSQKGEVLSLEIINQSGVSYQGNSIIEKNDYISETEQFVVIPPFGSSNLNLSLNKRPFLRQIKTEVIIYLNGQRFEQSITIKPSISQATVYSVTGVILGLIAFIARYIHLRRQKQKTVVYR